MSKKLETVKLHYWLALANVFYTHKGQTEVVGTSVNAVHATTDHRITSTDLGKIQQAVQIQVGNRAQGAELNFVDVTLSFSYMGHMTPTEFYGEGLVQGLKEGAAAARAVVK